MGRADGAVLRGQDKGGQRMAWLNARVAQGTTGYGIEGQGQTVQAGGVAVGYGRLDKSLTEWQGHTW